MKQSFFKSFFSIGLVLTVFAALVEANGTTTPQEFDARCERALSGGGSQQQEDAEELIADLILEIMRLKSIARPSQADRSRITHLESQVTRLEAALEKRKREKGRQETGVFANISASVPGTSSSANPGTATSAEPVPDSTKWDESLSDAFRLAADWMKKVTNSGGSPTVDLLVLGFLKGPQTVRELILRILTSEKQLSKDELENAKKILTTAVQSYRPFSTVRSAAAPKDIDEDLVGFVLAWAEKTKEHLREGADARTQNALYRILNLAEVIAKEMKQTTVTPEHVFLALKLFKPDASDPQAIAYGHLLNVTTWGGLGRSEKYGISKERLEKAAAVGRGTTTTSAVDLASEPPPEQKPYTVDSPDLTVPSPDDSASPAPAPAAAAPELDNPVIDLNAGNLILTNLSKEASKRRSRTEVVHHDATSEPVRAILANLLAGQNVAVHGETLYNIEELFQRITANLLGKKTVVRINSHRLLAQKSPNDAAKLATELKKAIEENKNLTAQGQHVVLILEDAHILNDPNLEQYLLELSKIHKIQIISVFKSKELSVQARQDGRLAAASAPVALPTLQKTELIQLLKPLFDEKVAQLADNGLAVKIPDAVWSKLLDRILGAKAEDPVEFGRREIGRIFTFSHEFFARPHEIAEQLIFKMLSLNEAVLTLLEDPKKLREIRTELEFINIEVESFLDLMRDHLGAKYQEALQSLRRTLGALKAQETKASAQELTFRLSSKGLQILETWIEKLDRRMADAKTDSVTANNSFTASQYLVDFIEKYYAAERTGTRKYTDAFFREMKVFLRSQIFGQDEAIDKVVDYLEYVFLESPKNVNNAGVFLFLGPTGVGKTKLTELVAEFLLGPGEDNYELVDPNRFSDDVSVNKLLGSPPGYVGYDEGSQLVRKIKRRGKLVLVFDELEKLHKRLRDNIFGLISYPTVTASNNETASMREVAVFITTNLFQDLSSHPERYLKGLIKKGEEGQKPLWDQEDLRRFAVLGKKKFRERILAPDFDPVAEVNTEGPDRIQYSPDQLRAIAEKCFVLEGFRPELIGRMTELVAFNALSSDLALRIVKQKIQFLVREPLIVEDQGMDVEATPAAIELIRDAAYNPESGGVRLVETMVSNWVAGPISKMKRERQLKPGQSVLITVDKVEGELQFHVVSTSSLKAARELAAQAAADGKAFSLEDVLLGGK